MEYVVVTEDYGQGAEPVALPVSRRTGGRVPDTKRPYTAYEVLTEFYGEDMSLVLGNYVKREPEKLRTRSKVPAKSARLLSYTYLFTRSRINQPISRTVVDCILRGNVEMQTERAERTTSRMNFCVRYILDLRPCSQKCIGPLIFPEDEEISEPGGILTNDHLLPILYTKDYERVAHDILRIFYPELRSGKALPGRFHVNGDDLARRMGLPVRDVHFADPSTLGQIFYNPGQVELLDDEGQAVKEDIIPGTILISIDNCKNPAIRNSTICHECSHMYLDRTFFFLQMMTGCRFSSYTSRRQERTGAYRKNGPIDWMELQCEKLPAYLLMESDSTKAFVESEVKRQGGTRKPEIMRKTIEKLSEQNQVSFSMTKYRLIELGFYEAEGIRCFVNGCPVPDHGCSKSWPEGVTYTISAKDAEELLFEDPSFHRIVISGRFRYVEGHFCLDEEKYVRENWKGIPYLTPYARSHIDECCIGFHASGRYKSTTYRNGQAFRNQVDPVTDRYRPRYALAAEPGSARYREENEVFSQDSYLWGELLYDLPDDFRGAVNMILSRKGITKERLAEELGVEKRVAIRYVNQECPSLPHVVGICIAMKVPFFISEKLVELSGNAFQRKPVHHQYREFLFQVDSLSVARCEDILAERKFPPLFRGQSRFE